MLRKILSVAVVTTSLVGVFGASPASADSWTVMCDHENKKDKRECVGAVISKCNGVVSYNGDAVTCHERSDEN